MKKNLLHGMIRPASALILGLSLTMVACQEESINPTLNLEDQLLSAEKGTLIPNQFIVVLRPEILTFRKSEDYAANQSFMRQTASSLLQQYRISEDKLGHVFSMALDGFAVELSQEQFDALSKDPKVQFIEQDQVMGIAQGRPGGGNGGGGGSTSPAQVTPWGINDVAGFVNYTGPKKAWVLDTGIDLTHPDLNVDQSNGFTAFTKGKDANFNDGNGHGTHVAGTIAAINNTIGVVGVAAGATVVPIKVLDSRGSGSNSGVIAGVDFVAANANAGDVANMSLGGGVSQALDNAVLAASSNGIIFTLAAGNSGADANFSSPARVNGPYIYTISAHNINGVFASFSNWGNPPIDYSAPGVSVQSTWLSGGYNTISGTSMAAPHAAGVLLLGPAKSNGFVTGDKDNTPDPKISR